MVAFLIEAMFARRIERVDPAQLAIGRVADRLLDSCDATGVGRLPQHIIKSFGVAHRE